VGATGQRARTASALATAMTRAAAGHQLVTH